MREEGEAQVREGKEEEKKIKDLINSQFMSISKEDRKDIKVSS